MDFATAAVEQCDRRIEGLEAMLRSIDEPVAGDDAALVRTDLLRMLEQEKALRAQLLEVASAPLPLEPVVLPRAVLLQEWRRAEKAAAAAETELRHLHRTSHGPKVREFGARTRALRQEADRLLAVLVEPADDIEPQPPGRPSGSRER